MINLFDRTRHYLKIALIVFAVILVLLVGLSVLIWRIPWFGLEWWYTAAPQQISLHRWDQEGFPVEAPLLATDSETNQVSALSDIAFDGYRLWITGLTSNGKGAVFSIDPQTYTMVSQIPMGADPRGIIFDGQHIWVANHNEGTVSCIPIEPGGYPGEMTTRTLVEDGSTSSPARLAFDGGYIWVTSPANNGLWRLSAKDCMKDSNDPDIKVLDGVLNQPFGILFDGTYIWVADRGGNDVIRLDPKKCDATACQSIKIVTGRAGSNPANLAYDGTYVWVTLAGTGEVARIHARTGSVFGRPLISQPIRISALAPAGDSLDAEKPCSNVNEGLDGILFDGKYLWIASNNGWICQLRANDVTPISQFEAGRKDCPAADAETEARLAFDGRYLWVVTKCSLIRR